MNRSINAAATAMRHYWEMAAAGSSKRKCRKPALLSEQAFRSL